MVSEVVVQVEDVFAQVPDLVENLFLNCYQAAVFIGYYSGASGDIVDEGDLPEGIAWVIVYLPFFLAILSTIHLHTIDSFQHNVKVVALIPFFKDHGILGMTF